MTQSYRTWLIHTWHGSIRCVTWLMHTWNDSSICYMTDSYVTWLIHMWHDSRHYPHPWKWKSSKLCLKRTTFVHEAWHTHEGTHTHTHAYTHTHTHTHTHTTSSVFWDVLKKSLCEPLPPSPLPLSIPAPLCPTLLSSPAPLPPVLQDARREFVMSHMWMSHVRHINESCHISECIMSA